jgi:two-component system OmpR family sensor kinase
MFTDDVDIKAHNARLQRLARVMAHDLITPIAVALGAVETAGTLLERRQTAGASVHMAMAKRRLLDLSHQMTQILNETITGASTGHAVNVAETAEAAHATLGPDVRERQRLITDDGPNVVGLPGVLHQVLANLLGNVAAHNDGPTSVWVSTVRRGGDVQILVDDDGRGWDGDPAELAVEGRSTSGSTGLGLTTVTQAIASLRGTVSFEPSPRGGARIRIELPAAAPATAGVIRLNLEAERRAIDRARHHVDSGAA